MSSAQMMRAVFSATATVTSMKHHGSFTSQRISDLANAGVILGHHCVGRDKRDAFRQRLGNKYPIKGILVQGWKPANENSMLAHDGEFFVAILEQTPPQQCHVDSEISTP